MKLQTAVILPGSSCDAFGSPAILTPVDENK